MKHHVASLRQQSLLFVFAYEMPLLSLIISHLINLLHCMSW